MIKRALVSSCILLSAAAQLHADSIDDAEAKRRGIPVSQVQAENALAKEKAKTAALEKQVADLQKQLADLQKQRSPSASQPRSATAPAPAPASARALGPASAPASARASTSSSSPANARQASVLYDFFVNRYLSGDWATLAADLAASPKDLAALAPANRADLDYIRQALAECRPAWWDQVKAGKSVRFAVTVWKQNLVVGYEDGPARYRPATGTISNISWPAALMDSRDPLPLSEFGLNFADDHGFVRDDLARFHAWSLVGGLALARQIGRDRPQSLSPEQQTQMDLYSQFFQNLTAAYYGTPSSRRMIALASVTCLESHVDNVPTWIPYRPFGVALMLDVAARHDLYKHLHIEPIVGLEKIDQPGTAEGFLANTLLVHLLDAKLNLDEDRRLREIVKALVDDNPDWTSHDLKLPAGHHFNFDHAADIDNAKKRVAAYNAGAVKSDTPPTIPADLIGR